MCANGVGIGMVGVSIKLLQALYQSILQALLLVRSAYFAAVAGTSARGAAALHSAATIRPHFASSASAFG